MASRLKYVFISLLLATAARADYIPPDRVTIQTPAYQPDNMHYEPALYTYGVYWQGIPVATAEVLASYEDPGQRTTARVEARARTVKGIDLLYKLRHVSRSTFKLNGFRPIEFQSQQTENSRAKRASIVFHEGGRVVSMQQKDDKPAETMDFAANNLMLDPISAAFLARSIPIEVGKDAAFDVFNGKHRYLINFKVEAIETIKLGKQQIRAFKVTPAVKKLTDSKGENRLKSATLWISADDKRHILKLESKVLVGSVRARLDKITPLGKAARQQPAPSTPPGPQ